MLFFRSKYAQRFRHRATEPQSRGERAKKILRASLTLCLTLVAFVSQLAAQEAQDKEKQGKQTDIGTIRFNTDLVTVDAIVTDRAGNRITTTLKPSDFTIYEDGVRQTINSFSATDAPRMSSCLAT
jgi:hypothetical protein